MNTIIAQIKLSHPNGVLIINLYDTPASHQLLAQIPLTLDFSDYVNSEKIAYLPRKLSINNTPNTLQQIGDFTYYAPWGNLAIFYYDSTRHRDLYALGYIVSGKEQLVTITDNFTASLSIVD
ncbi:cyclophilin-like fold protein [Orbus mooreae]|uniref:cyclophilin-like fold protein n=1 Tax=Orbus mooreae TaxID=3074107 RepID=UPI00370D972B